MGSHPIDVTVCYYRDTAKTYFEILRFQHILQQSFNLVVVLQTTLLKYHTCNVVDLSQRSRAVFSFILVGLE